MVECRSYVSTDLYKDIEIRAKDLGISKSEYFRILATLDTSIHMYQRLLNCLEYFYDSINSMYEKLGINGVSLQVPKLNSKN